jgi:hypothetical protein
MRLRKWIALALLGLPALASAQSVVQDGQSTRGVQQSTLGGHLVRSDSTQDANTGDGSGNQYITEANPDRTFLKKYQNVIQNVLYPTGSQILSLAQRGPQSDSTSARDMLGCKHIALKIHYTLDDSARAALLAITVQGGYVGNNDSVSVASWRNWRAAAVPATWGTVPKDTIGTFSTNPAVMSYIDSTGISASDELIVVLSEIGAPGNLGGRDLWINLVDPVSGEWFNAPYVSIRVRLIGVYAASMVRHQNAKAPATAISADLVGWR